MRTLDREALAQAARSRFRSAYDYAIFEYLRSAKLIATLERAGVRIAGRVLDSGCGGGGVALSFAEETSFVVGLDLAGGFRDSGLRLAAEKALANLRFIGGDGTRLPFAGETFDLVLSHSVIEHVSSAETYLRECRRVLKPGGALYLSTAPYLSFAGAHLPRLIVPVPVHILFGRSAAFRLFRFFGRHAPWLLLEEQDANTFVSLPRKSAEKHDDLLQRVTVTRLKRWIDAAGLRLLNEERHVTGFFRRFVPAPLRPRLERTPWIQDVMIGQIQCVLARP